MTKRPLGGATAGRSRRTGGPPKDKKAPPAAPLPSLTRRELLALLARNPGRTYSRADLLNLVWGHQYEGYEHTVNSHINRLRAKIENDPGHPRLLRTVWGVGYRFSEPGELA